MFYLVILPPNFKWFILLLLSRFGRVQLCDPTDGNPPGSAVPGILQARTLEWVAISFSNDSYYFPLFPIDIVQSVKQRFLKQDTEFLVNIGLFVF